jgi:hypothetical protein
LPESETDQTKTEQPKWSTGTTVAPGKVAVDVPNEKVAAVIIESTVTPGMFNANVSGPARKGL